MSPTTTTTTNNNANKKWITIQTPLPNPLPPNPSRRPIPTARLLLRPFHPTDLAPLHALQRQPEVMCWTSKGRPDADEAETARKLAQFLPPNDARTYNWAVCLRGSGELIGVGGVHDFGGGADGAAAGDGDGDGDDDDDDDDDDNGGFGWPEIGYLLRREYWGKGYGTEFLRAFLGAWEGELLRREVVERRVKVGSFERVGGGNDTGPVLGREQLVAIIDRRNAASRKVLEKCGFESFADFEQEDSCDPEKVIELVAYRYFPKVAS